MSIKNIEQDILKWHRENFPRATLNAKLDKLIEECHELLNAIADYDMQEILDEAADVFIVAASIAGDKRYFEDNVSMSRVIADKLKLRMASEWGAELPNGNRERVK